MSICDLLFVVCFASPMIQTDMPLSVNGHYSATLLYAQANKDLEARDLVSHTTLNLGPKEEFQLRMGKSLMVGRFEVSGRFLVLHMKQIDGKDATKVKGAARSVINQVYEISGNGRVLSFVNAPPSSTAIKFIRVTTER